MRLFGQEECDKNKILDYVSTPLSERALQIVHSEIRYEPYITREKQEIKKTENLKSMVIPAQFNYTAMPGLSKELQQKLTKHQPSTIAHAALIPGMTPAAISLLIFRIRQ